MSEDNDLELLKKLIRQSHNRPDDDELQGKTIQKCVNYISNFPTDKHLFCDPDGYYIGTHSLIIFSFPESPALGWLQPKIAHYLDTCQKCIYQFHKGRSWLRREFLTTRKLDYESVAFYTLLIYKWESARLVVVLEEAQRWLLDPQPVFPSKYILPIIECLCGPGMLRENQVLLGLFNSVFDYILANDIKFNINRLCPGVIYLLFEGSRKQQLWALNALPEPLTGSQWSGILEEEYEVHLYKIQDPKYYNDDTCEKFWKAMVPIINCCDKQVIVGHLQAPKNMEYIQKDFSYKLVPLVSVITNQIMSFQKKPLAIILRAFNSLLKSLSGDYWQFVSPLIYNNYLDTIFGNPYYLKYLLQLSPPTSAEPAPGNLDDLVFWINSMFKSLSSSQRQQAGVRIADWFLKVSADREIHLPEFTRSLLIIVSCDLLSQCLTLDVKLYDLKFTVDLLVRAEARTLVDKQIKLVIEWCFKNTTNQFLTAACIKLLCKSISFDILNFSHNSYCAYRGEPSSLAPFSKIMWDSLTQNSFKSSNSSQFKDLMVALLGSLKNVHGILKVKTDEKHSAQYTEVLQYLNNLLLMFSEADLATLKTVLHSKDALDGLWALILSPEQEISQNATSILYEAYDSTGRFEGIQAMLRTNLKACLDSVDLSLANTMACGYYEPCPRIVRVLMDVVNGINDPISGLLGDFSVISQYQDFGFIDKFWTQCWTFLVFIYRQTLTWAAKYRASQLVEFTRDTLDLSHLVLGCFKGFVEVLNHEPDKKHVIEKTLFQHVLQSFKSMMVWLRLSDMALLTLCLDLIFKTINLASELNLVFDNELIVLLTKYASKAKKFNNKLTPQQTAEILLLARNLNSALVDKTLVDTGEVRKTVSPSPAPPPAKKIVIHPPSKSGFHSKRAKKESDSDSDSDNELDPGIKELFTGAKKTKPGLLTKLPQLKSGNLKRPTNPVDEQKRKELLMRKRLNVNLDGFYKKLLSWPYNQLGDYPGDIEDSQYKPVVDSFDNVASYQQTFEPLLLLECWQSIQQAKEIGQDKPFELLIGTRTSVDNFFDVFASMKKVDQQAKKLGENDLIALTSIDDYKGNIGQVKAKDFQTQVSCLAKISLIKSANSEYVDITMRIVPDRNVMVNFLNPQTTILALKVIQMTTVEREYSSLFGLPYYDLMSSIIHATPSYNDFVDDRLIDKMVRSFKVNKSQAKAIAGSVSSKGFSLIQGPPGTGKTKTILGIVGYFLTHHNSKSIQIPGAKPVKPTTEVAKKILICAPSNAAVDELVLRLRSEIPDHTGTSFRPNVVRLGRSDAINSAVKDLTLEELVEKELEGRNGDSKVSDNSIREELTKCLAQRDELRTKLNQEELPEEQAVQLQLKLREVVKLKNELGKKLDQQREQVSISYRNKEIEKRNVQFKILNKANIICSTLSGSAHDLVRGMNITCDTVIIDEACQCTELSAIIPLRYGCETCIMVGDPNQLPPTVLSQAAAKYNYEQSLFVRMQKNQPDSIYLLDVQYRMHPDISVFPSDEFYDSRLLDGDNMAQVNARPWHQQFPLTPYRFFDIKSTETQDRRSKSYFNTTEITVAWELVDALEKLFVSSGQSLDGKIGIISPYKEQIFKLKTAFVSRYGKPILNAIDFNTVDGFQGQEKEVIIMSCVRANNNKAVGFLSDVRRMNVALTRAKTTLWVLGNLQTLNSNRVWRDLIFDANSRKCCTQASPGFLKRPFVAGVASGNAPARKNKPTQKKPASPVSSASVPTKPMTSNKRPLHQEKNPQQPGKVPKTSGLFVKKKHTARPKAPTVYNSTPQNIPLPQRSGTVDDRPAPSIRPTNSGMFLKSHNRRQNNKNGKSH